jgi:precorrin-6B methylase 1
VKKHLSTFDRSFLNRWKIPFIGKSNISRAKDAEAIESSARQLDVIADLIQSKTGEPRDPEEEKKLKKLYLETFMTRPK